MTKYLVIVGALIVILTLCVVMARSQRCLDHSFSLHAAQRRDLYLLFAFGITAAMAVFAVWFWRWFVPVYVPGQPLQTVFSVFLLLMVVTAWIPWRPGLKGQIHDAAFYTATGLLPCIALLSAQLHSLPVSARSVSWIALGLELLLGLVFIFRNREVKRRFFVFQAIFLSVALLQLIAITFLK